MSRHDQGWADNNPIAAYHRWHDLFWARLVLVAEFMVEVLAMAAIVVGIGALIAAFTPGGGHGF